MEAIQCNVCLTRAHCLRHLIVCTQDVKQTTVGAVIVSILTSLGMKYAKSMATDLNVNNPVQLNAKHQSNAATAGVNKETKSARTAVHPCVTDGVRMLVDNKPVVPLVFPTVLPILVIQNKALVSNLVVIWQQGVKKFAL
jgi:hypothetical protein